MKILNYLLAASILLFVASCGDDDEESTPTPTPTPAACVLESFDGGTAEAISDFSDANQDYNFDDYTDTFPDINITVNDSCNSLTITGNFLDWGTVDDTFTPTLTLDITPDASDDNVGTLTFTEEVMGAMADGFTYRMSTSGEAGTYNVSDKTMTIKVFVDYDVAGSWTYWYTNTSTFTLQ